MDGMLGLVNNDFITYPTVFARLWVHVNISDFGPFFAKINSLFFTHFSLQ